MSSPPNFTIEAQNNEENDWDDDEDESDDNAKPVGASRLHEKSVAKKLEEVARTLQRLRWTFDTFLYNWVQEKDTLSNDIILESWILKISSGVHRK